MPIFEYECVRCGKIFETILPVSRRDKPRKKCACGGTARRLIATGVGLRFNGSGTHDSDRHKPGEIKDLSDHPDARRILGTGCAGGRCEA